MNHLLEVEYIERVAISIVVIVASVAILFFTIKSLRSHIRLLKEKGIRPKLIRKAVVPVLVFVSFLAFRLNLPLLISDSELFSSASRFIDRKSVV